jgi:ribonuclease HII
MWSHDFFEKILHCRGHRLIAGVDEVGRGALAGPVVAAAVVLSGDGDYREIRDSKVLTARRRAILADRIRAEALGFGIGSVPEAEVDRLNVLQATHEAMRQAVAGLPFSPDIVLVDGFWLSGLDAPCIGIVDGDARSYSIAAASIVAKVHRDGFMTVQAAEYPQYGFDRNKGYGTENHRQAILEHGPCPLHRRTFGGVRSMPAPGGDYAR